MRSPFAVNLIHYAEKRLLTVMDVKTILIVLTAVFTVSCLFFGTKNGFYDTDNYHGNGSAH